MNHLQEHCLNGTSSTLRIWTVLGAVAAVACMAQGQTTAMSAPFGPDNPFYIESTLPFQAPPFDKIKDSDYQPAIDAGMAAQLLEVNQIADNPAPPTFENTIVAFEKTGQLLERVELVFNCVTGANTNDALQKVQEYEAPRLSAHEDAIYLNSKLFARVKAIYDQRDTLHLDPESLRLVEFDYQQFVKAGANLSDSDKEKLKKNNEEDSKLENAFMNKLLAGSQSRSLLDHGPGGAGRPERSADRRGGTGCPGAQAAGMGNSAAEHHAAA